MYNKDRKELYIEVNEPRNQHLRQVASRLFTYAAMFEEKFGKDLADFSLKEITEYYKYLNVTSLESLMNTNSQCKLYTAWCVNQNLVGDLQNHYAEITKEILQPCLNKEMTESKIITWDELLELADELMNDHDKFLMFAFYEGIGGHEYEDFNNLRVDNFRKDGDDYIVALVNREIRCSERCFHYAVLSSEEYEYETVVVDEDGARITKGYFDQSDDRVVKKGRNSRLAVFSFNAIKVRMDKIRMCLSRPSLSIHSLNESGRINEIRKRMAEGRDVRDVVKDRDIEIKYGKIQAVDRYLMKYFAE